jgi:hypothetical protein
MLATLGAVLPAHGHDPFDGNTEVVVTERRITVNVTLGYDAARAVLAAQPLPPDTAAALARGSGRRQIGLPLAAAPQLVAIEAGGAPLAATSFLVAPDEVEFTFQVVYPRPGGATVLLRAGYFSATRFMLPGTVIVLDQQRRLMARSVVSAAAPTAEVPLALAPGAVVQADARRVVEHLASPAAGTPVSDQQGSHVHGLVTALGVIAMAIAALLLLWRWQRRA